MPFVVKLLGCIGYMVLVITSDTFLECLPSKAGTMGNFVFSQLHTQSQFSCFDQWIVSSHWFSQQSFDVQFLYLYALYIILIYIIGQNCNKMNDLECQNMGWWLLVYTRRKISKRLLLKKSQQNSATIICELRQSSEKLDGGLLNLERCQKIRMWLKRRSISKCMLQFQYNLYTNSLSYYKIFFSVLFSSV